MKNALSFIEIFPPLGSHYENLYENMIYTKNYSNS